MVVGVLPGYSNVHERAIYSNNEEGFRRLRRLRRRTKASKVRTKGASKASIRSTTGLEGEDEGGVASEALKGRTKGLPPQRRRLRRLRRLEGQGPRPHLINIILSRSETLTKAIFNP